MFSDWGWIQERTAKQRENLDRWMEQHNSSKLLVLEFGAGKSVPTVRMTCEEIARSNKGKLIRVNLREADSSSIEIIPIELTAKEAIQRMSEI
jgi:NAD-dependent SIR2 family protein deacetylase